MVQLRIAVEDLPDSWATYSNIQLKLQSKKNYQDSADGIFVVDMELKPNRNGEMHWKGDAVHFHGDGRRFIYLAWLHPQGHLWTSFRRIKVYLDKIPTLANQPESGTFDVTIKGRGKDGSPACATATIVS